MKNNIKEEIDRLFTSDDLKQLEYTLLSNIKILMKDELWGKAFSYYNLKNRIGMNPMTMGCRPCYYKVLKFLINGNDYS